jgi:EAL domain-containing protein (putative c-di-GMP-specific phosphodiesterase class I)
MDPLEILTNKENVFPVFQPIFSADEQIVIGYEILGRYRDEDGTHSLGPFFHDESIPDEYRMEIEDDLQMQALERIFDHNSKLLMFINRHPDLLMKDRGQSLLEQLLLLQEHGLSLDRIVIEITEHQFRGDIEQLNHVFTYLRTYGIQLAVDNVGRGSSNLDRLRLLKPDILKVDLQILKQTTSPNEYEDIFQSLSMLARKIGATLLYESIESPFQLQYAWKHSGRFYQGYFLARPEENFVAPTVCKQMLTEQFVRFIGHEKKKLLNQYQLTETLNRKLEEHHLKNKELDDDELAFLVAKTLNDISFRVYICDENGLQTSANMVKVANEWKKQLEYKGKNWSWRPYFLENIIRMDYVKKGILSDLYSDIETGEMIRTFSFPIREQYYLFIDLPYAFIYSQDGLL